VRRSIGSMTLRNLTPFLMLDHFHVGKGAVSVIPFWDSSLPEAQARVSPTILIGDKQLSHICSMGIVQVSLSREQVLIPCDRKFQHEDSAGHKGTIGMLLSYFVFLHFIDVKKRNRRCPMDVCRTWYHSC
jgi:hypothetical protein